MEGFAQPHYVFQRGMGWVAGVEAPTSPFPDQFFWKNWPKPIVDRLDVGLIQLSWPLGKS